VGDGVKQLLRLSVGEGGRGTFDEALRVFRAHYLAHCLDHTTFYPGVGEMLAHFAGKRKAVATNKSIEYTNAILQGLGANHFQYVVGGDNGFGSNFGFMSLAAVSTCPTMQDVSFTVAGGNLVSSAVHSIGIKLGSSGTGPWANPTVLNVDSITTANNGS
jgi:phosphoglycolate phosphatase